MCEGAVQESPPSHPNFQVRWMSLNPIAYRPIVIVDVCYNETATV